jgi:hypothetical protein
VVFWSTSSSPSKVVNICVFLKPFLFFSRSTLWRLPCPFSTYFCTPVSTPPSRNEHSFVLHIEQYCEYKEQSFEISCYFTLKNLVEEPSFRCDSRNSFVYVDFLLLNFLLNRLEHTVERAFISFCLPKGFCMLLSLPLNVL